MRKPSCLICAALLLHLASTARGEDMPFKVDSNLRAAVARIDITPPPGTPIVGHVRGYKGARGALHAVILLLDDGRTRAAIAIFTLVRPGRDGPRLSDKPTRP